VLLQESDVRSHVRVNLCEIDLIDQFNHKHHLLPDGRRGPRSFVAARGISTPVPPTTARRSYSGESAPLHWNELCYTVTIGTLLEDRVKTKILTMNRTLWVVACAVLTWSPVLAADRLTDRDVKDLVARIEQGRDRFDDALDDKLKNTILRGPSGEVIVSQFLNDFQENIDRLEERLKPDYAASTEAGTLLRQASAIDRFFRQQPPGTKGERMEPAATDLKTLAAAYGTDFRFPKTPQSVALAIVSLLVPRTRSQRLLIA
jgi:hypothetical protein